MVQHVVTASGREGVAQKKQFFVDQMSKGKQVKDCLNALGMSRQNYEHYRRSDPIFKQKIDDIRTRREAGLGGKVIKPLPPFDVFCEEYLGTRLFRHQLQWWDLLEGRPPRELHPNQRFEPGSPNMLLINTPPDHAKSTTITINYITYRILQDPNVQVLIVSKTGDMAKKFLRAIKDRLTGPTFKKLQTDFAPEGGYEANSAGWTQSHIYVNGEARDSGEKDPTVEALGIGKQIYGARADIVILDDCVDDTNATNFVNQIDWLQNMVDSRLDPIAGQLLVVGTRVAPLDLYGELRRPIYWGEDDESPFTYLTQPAVLEFAEDPEDWVTLWPRSNMPPRSVKARALVSQGEDGLYPRWDGPTLKKVRAKKSVRNWSMIYMQDQVAEDSVFKMEDILGCVSHFRGAGLMYRGQKGHREYGMEGLYIVAGLDPAMTGHTAAVIVGLDRITGKRYVLDVYDKAAPRPDELRQLIKDWTVTYKVQEWRIEKNAFQIMLTQDREVREFLAQRGAILAEHFTGANKWDINFGIASMSMLFEGWQEGRNLIELPTRNAECIKALTEQLTTWEPDTKGKTDILMALWFTEIRCRDLVNQDWAAFHLKDNMYSTARSREGQGWVDLDVLMQGQGQG